MYGPGSPGNLGGPVVSVNDGTARTRTTKPSGMDVRESERPIVLAKPGNPSRGDPVEGRGRRSTGPMRGQMTETQDLQQLISTRLQRIAEIARKYRGQPLRTLAHHIDDAFLLAAYRRTRKDGAPGIDGESAQEFSTDLPARLADLRERFKTGRYKAPPVRRAYIPKADGRQRPLGLPTFEDKVLQRAVTMVLEAVYEQEFLPCSYGFRPRRSAHQALADLRQVLMQVRGGWVLDVDIKGFFDNLDHAHLRSFLDKRVRDRVIRRATGKWLKAGVLEDGRMMQSDSGTPQGGVISPLLANVYLHEVLDTWFHEVVQPRLGGYSRLIRYADDFVIVCTSEDDARRVLAVLPKRFGKFGLELHPAKTRLVHFGRPRRSAEGKGDDDTGRRPGTFDFLGLTHYWGRTRRGGWAVKQRTMAKRLNRSIKAVADWCRRFRHLPVAVQHWKLSQKVRGHYNYYGITGNSMALGKFHRSVIRVWRKWLDRRSQKRSMPWERFWRLYERYPLPPPRVRQPFPA